MTHTPEDGTLAHARAPVTDLWMILAIIQPFRLDAVMRALESVPGFTGMTVDEVRGFGHEKVEADRHPDRAVTRERGLDDFTRKVRIEVVAAGGATTEEIVDVIARTAHTGSAGDGKIFTWPVTRAVRVMTGAEGSEAL